MDLEKSFRLLRLIALVPFLFGPADLHAHNAPAVLAGEATVYENEADNNGGGDSQVCIGNIATTATRRAFVRYTLPAIAAGSTVYRVVWGILQDRVRDPDPGPGPLAATLQVRRVTAAWVEGTGSGGGLGPCGGGANVAGVDWATQPTVAAADSAAAALSADDAVSVVFDTNTGHDGLLTDVQAWVDSGASNFGWRLAVVEEGTADNARALTPGTLTIHWTPPDEDHLFADGFETP